MSSVLEETTGSECCGLLNTCLVSLSRDGGAGMEVLGVAWGLVAPDSSPHTHVPRGEDLHLSDSFGRDHGCGQAPAYQGKEYKEMVAGLG